MRLILNSTTDHLQSASKIMKAVLLGLTLPAIRGAQLTYPDDIALFEFSWTNPDQGTAEETGPTNGTLMTDGVTTVGSGETLTNPEKGVWGDVGAATTVGMDGTFQATTLNLGTGFAFWLVSTAEVVFDAGGCFTSDTTASAFYYDFATSTRVILTTTTTSDANDIWTFSADIAVCSIDDRSSLRFQIEISIKCLCGSFSNYKYAVAFSSKNRPRSKPMDISDSK